MVTACACRTAPTSQSANVKSPINAVIIKHLHIYVYTERLGKNCAVTHPNNSLTIKMFDESYIRNRGGLARI